MSGNIYQRALFQRNAVVFFTFRHILVVLVCIGLSAGVTIAVGLLLYYQVQSILITNWVKGIGRLDLYDK